MDNGWICMHRKILDWEWYGDSKMFHLFFHLCASANYEDSQWKGRVVKKGQLITGRKKLSSETGISEWSVRTCLGRLVKSGEITIQLTGKFSVITICNYNKYQDQYHADPQTTHHKPTRKVEKNVENPQTTHQLQVVDVLKDIHGKYRKTSKTHKQPTRKVEKNVENPPHTNNKQNNNNNNTRVSNKKRCNFSPDSNEVRVSLLLADLILEWHPDNGVALKAKKDPQKWAGHIDLAHRIDGRSFENLEKVIRWAQQHDFWRPNILSTRKLRKQYDLLKAQMLTDEENAKRRVRPMSSLQPRTYAQAKDAELRCFAMKIMARKEMEQRHEKTEKPKSLEHSPDSRAGTGEPDDLLRKQRHKRAND